MSLETIGLLPSQAEINEQYTPGTNLHKSLGILHAMRGNYQFGALTADYYGLTGQERQNWLDEAATYPDNVKQKIKDAIVQALSHKHNGNDAPISLKLSWTKNGGPPDVQVTYDPGAPSYTIEIFNCIAPMALRRDRKKY